MGEIWDWRQKYAQYSDTPEPSSSPYSAPPAPEVPVVDDRQVYANPYAPPQEWVQPSSFPAPIQAPVPVQGQPHVGAYPQFAGYPATPMPHRRGRGFSIAAFICGGLALVLFPILLGPLGIIFGFVADSKGDRVGRLAGLMSIATTALGMAFSIWVARKVGVRFGG